MSARLHLGCGLVHRPRWINLDRSATDAADLLGEAFLLPFGDSSVESVEALQLVEHLGYVGTLYALHEWARVLVPGGTLRVETPDRDATLRAALDEANGDTALPWLFGMEERGLAHRYLFSASELAELVRRAGFEAVVAGTTQSQPSRPTLQICARRAPDTSQSRFANRLRRAFVLAGLVRPTDTPPYMGELETICEQAADLIQTPGGDTLLQLFGLSARYSPRVATCVLGALPSSPDWPGEVLSQVRRLIAELARERFPARLACRWRTTPKVPGTEDSAWASLEREISLYLTARLHPGAGLDDVRDAFDRATAHPTPADHRVDFFCRGLLTDLAHRLTARGVRAFAQGDWELAADMLETAIGYAPARVWPRWNLARLHVRQKQLLAALEHYEALLAILPPALRDAFELELDAVVGRSGSADVFAVPLADVTDLLTAAG